MGNLTISLDDAVIRQARVRAIQEGTSVSAKVREFLATYAQVNDQKRQAGQAILEAARQSQANRAGATWTRDNLHDRSAAAADQTASGQA